MSRISQVMTHDHKSCDEALAAAEAAVAEGDWPRAVKTLETFGVALERHFEVEEDKLFPAFEAHTGMADGPTAMMRIEHADMRELLGQLRAAAAARDADEFLGLTETLNVLMQQHNLKEEQVLYVLLDETLGAEADTLLADLLHA
jgi:iron-sulfur cluster repair protein YtfE (RIC family)